MTLQTAPSAVSLDGVRARFRALGLRESGVGASFLYAPPARDAVLLVLQEYGNGAQIYLFPDALGRPPGVAGLFYRTLDEAGFRLGSKAGPSISLDLADGERMTRFWDAFADLMRAG